MLIPLVGGGLTLTASPASSATSSKIDDSADALTAVFFSWVLLSNRGRRAERRGSEVTFRLPHTSQAAIRTSVEEWISPCGW